MSQVVDQDAGGIVGHWFYIDCGGWFAAYRKRGIARKDEGIGIACRFSPALRGSFSLIGLPRV